MSRIIRTNLIIADVNKPVANQELTESANPETVQMFQYIQVSLQIGEKTLRAVIKYSFAYFIITL